MQVVGLVAGYDEKAAEQHLEEDGDLGGAEQVPKANRGLVTEPLDPPDEARHQVQDEEADGGPEVHFEHRAISAREGRDSAC